ncbi:TPA: HlyD family efflux transporter periplasmic adaptor subunit [Escherichia coli]|jgi:HlyD family secretion protein|nr:MULTISPECIES: HlyD family efflux transporter periplasmic adaptor subunit [Gammaproteobacteria]EFE7737458.1 HlyD family efflux transporter periplasmic adaptor subunit [Escherichia coli]EJA9920252.1 HlyD family efflux transporter periplasmic adaptor subunit [Pseudomonas aeruginosa]MBK3430763.1 HlyD family efflux transporter periplasmic adaptor subunit [Pseudomonas fluorescens]AUY33159.1 hemolysin D [Pseudomonas sp. PONIH3]EFL9698042.1 HlyD family efflux transporter periplasmic adaptor subunit
MNMSISMKNKVLPAVLIAGALLAGWWYWSSQSGDAYGEGFVSGNGRIEAIQTDISTKLGGRIEQVLVREGHVVKAGEPLARMQVDILQAQRAEADAGRQRAEHAVSSAEAQVALNKSNLVAAQAVVAQREAELDAARRRVARSEILSKEGASSVQELDDNRAAVRGAQAAVAASVAQVSAAQAAVKASEADVVGARSAVVAALATVTRIDADINDSELRAPRDGRVQFRVAEPGEVLSPGGTVLNIIDLSDVYMTFFLPEKAAGRIELGSEVRIVLDSAPDNPIKATVSFVASNAQFTPKSVETASERQKLMFRVRAQVSEDFLRRHAKEVKAGVPGVAWVKLDAESSWPTPLAIRAQE